MAKKDPESIGSEDTAELRSGRLRVGDVGRSVFEQRADRRKNPELYGKQRHADIRLPNQSGEVDPRLKRKSTRKVGRAARRTAR